MPRGRYGDVPARDNREIRWKPTLHKMRGGRAMSITRIFKAPKFLVHSMELWHTCNGRGEAGVRIRFQCRGKHAGKWRMSPPPPRNQAIPANGETTKTLSRVTTAINVNADTCDGSRAAAMKWSRLLLSSPLLQPDRLRPW